MWAGCDCSKLAIEDYYKAFYDSARYCYSLKRGQNDNLFILCNHGYPNGQQSVDRLNDMYGKKWKFLLVVGIERIRHANIGR